MDKGLKEIPKLKKLGNLRLFGTQITDAGLKELVKRQQLTTLPSEIGQLTNLTGLSLHGVQFTTLPSEIGKLTKLTELQIEKNPLTDTDLEHLKPLKSLKRLDVRDTKVTIAGVEAFRKALPNCEVKVPRQ